MGEGVKLSIVIAVLDSHEIVRRQIVHFAMFELPEKIEIVIVDDGSSMPISDWLDGELPGLGSPETVIDCPNATFRIIQTNDTRRWTQGLARMKGIEAAQGDYIFCTDIDHIISREAIEFALTFDGDKANFQRRFAYLDESGNLVRDREKVIEWGLDPKHIRDAELSDGVHGNTWLMRKSLFWELGGYDRKRCESGTHLQGEDREFNKRYANAQREGKVKPIVTGPPIYFFPMGRYHKTGDENPFGLFHNMKKEKWGDPV